MEELSDGQKSRVVFAKLGRDVPHILLLDEPTNHLDMESIDALAKAVNMFDGGLVLVSHDMRLISQVAKEIWICDHKTVAKYNGDIQNFKMDMRSQMGIEGEQKGQLRGDASVKKKKDAPEKKVKKEKKEKKLAVVDEKTVPVPEKKKVVVSRVVKPVEKVVDSKPSKQSDHDAWGSDEDDGKKNDSSTKSSSLSSLASMKSSLPEPDRSSSRTSAPKPSGGRYIPPHLRNR